MPLLPGEVPPNLFPILGAGRILIGAGLIFAPGGLARGLGIDPQSATASRWLTRIAGAREVGIGIGAIRAWHRQEDPSGWILAQAISDSTDVVAFGAAAVSGKVSAKRGVGMAAFAASGAVSEIVTFIALEKKCAEVNEEF
jgi:hypothetical protein